MDTKYFFLTPKIEFLLVTDSLTQKSNAKQDEANDIHGSVVIIFCIGTCWSIDKNHWQTHSEHPDSLVDPEHGKPQWIWPFVIKPVIFSYLDDPVQQVTG